MFFLFMSLFFHHKRSKFPTLRALKNPLNTLHNKHEYFLDVSSFMSLPSSLKIVDLSRLEELFRFLSLSLSVWVFLPRTFKNSLLNSMSDSTATIVDARPYTPCLFSSIFAFPHRPSRKDKSASYFPHTWNFQKKPLNSLMYSRETQPVIF